MEKPRILLFLCIPQNLSLRRKTLHFGQKQPIHIAIRQLTHECPQDEAILKELIQDADDGGASEINFILDRTRYPTANGPVQDWQQFAQPALVVFNDQHFSQEVSHKSFRVFLPGQSELRRHHFRFSGTALEGGTTLLTNVYRHRLVN